MVTYPEKLFIGLDVGSVSVNTVVMDAEANILLDYYDRIAGEPLKRVLEVLKRLDKEISLEKVESIAFTGDGGKLISELLDGTYFVNEVIAQSKSTIKLYPEVRTVIEMGGQDSKLLLFEYDKSIEEVVLKDFAMNTICAAGTGSFLDQQANRLGVSIEKEFGELALKSEHPPRIAGRCSVFAKSDMIHLQQVATPDYDIVAGLCFAVARNFQSSIAKGKKFVPPISFQGGVAANAGMRRAFTEVLELDEKGLIIPEYFTSMGAIGAVLNMFQDKKVRKCNCIEILKKIEEHINNSHYQEKDAYEPLGGIKDYYTPPQYELYEFPKHGTKIEVYLGIDVGSISTNLVVIDENCELLAKQYLMTAGRPIEAVRKGLKLLGDDIEGKVIIMGVGTTGSGRYLTGDFVGADIVRNEITAQATGALSIDETVDTIFEIGGQDSKYISLDNGTVIDFEMNKVCAAGTGSFLEEQAEKLDIDIKKEFSQLACYAPSPSRMGERCTVFIETDLVHHQQNGASKEDLLAGLSYSIVYNYLNRVVADRRVGDKIFFQGGTAFNKGVVAAFEKVTGKKITVPPHHDVTGAIGVAILAMKEKDKSIPTTFRGFDLSERNYTIESFECKACSNICEIRKVVIENEKPFFYGGRCEKYEMKKVVRDDIPDLFAEREDLLNNTYDKTNENAKTSIGIPKVLYFHELLPLWKAFFSELGYKVVMSDTSNKKLIHEGVEHISAETCFPIKIVHGHIINLVEKGVDYIFLPSIINQVQKNKTEGKSQNCPYVQTVPYIIRAALDLKIPLLTPILYMQRGFKAIRKDLVKFAKEHLNKNKKDIENAFDIAWEYQEKFYIALAKRGEEVLKQLPDNEKGIVIVSRPYNGCDPGLNLELPKKLRELGVLAIPMDFLPLDDIDVFKEWPNMFWRYGQKILNSAKIIRQRENLYALYITNFGCGPDSFITHFFRKVMNGKPYLQIEVDEHSAGAGAITRCEAYLDSLKNTKFTPPERIKKLQVVTRLKKEERTLYLQYMCEHAHLLQAAFQSTGINAEVLPPSDQETLEWGRKFTLGKECYPCIVSSGDILKKVNEPGFDPKKAAFFLPDGGGPCRFGQYSRLNRMILDELGFDDVPLFAPSADNSYDELGTDFHRKGWQAVVISDI